MVNQINLDVSESVSTAIQETVHERFKEANASTATKMFDRYVREQREVLVASDSASTDIDDLLTTDDEGQTIVREDARSGEFMFIVYASGIAHSFPNLWLRDETIMQLVRPFVDS
jgi:hypothetical protein